MTLRTEDHIDNALASLRAAATALRVTLGNMNRHWLDKQKNPEERPLAKDLYSVETQIRKVESMIDEIKKTFNYD